jgi:hypothetical protein
MRSVSRSDSYWMLVATGVALFGCFLILSNRADAQSQGNNAVYNSSGTCTSSSCGVPRSLRFLQGAGALVEYDCEENILAAVNASF